MFSSNSSYFGNSCIHNHNRNKLYIDIISKAIDSGIKILGQSSDKAIVDMWQEYAKSVVKIVAEQYGLQIYTDYLNFLIAIISKSPEDQIKDSINKLLDIMKKMGQIKSF